MFTLFFFFFIFAAAQLFFIQLGPYLDSYNNITSAFVTLFRALFGDFDLTAIMDNSSSYTNAILLMLYLFGAIFVLLSIFLTILGEHQEGVRGEQQEAKEAGTSAPEYGILSYIVGGINGEVGFCMDLTPNPNPDPNPQAQPQPQPQPQAQPPTPTPSPHPQPSPQPQPRPGRPLHG